ncbi:MAG: hypothetical protein JWM74_4988 [Myxococcaceae bacterium]|nr:hypothetical protein [Myxococcaceae bacterium]
MRPRSVMRLLPLLSCAFVLLGARTAEAAPPTAAIGTYSPYEQASVRAVAAKLHAEIVPNADGKLIESVEVFPLEVLEDRDPLPGFAKDILNSLHSTSRPYVIRREVLLDVGDPYDEALAQETARNLRRLRQLSLVIIAPFRGSREDRVRLVVITKDVWSLRMGFDIGAGPGGLERLLLEPTESNLAGSHQTVLARFSYRPESYALGASYLVPRLQGLRLSFVADANAIINKRRGDLEGSFGTVSISRPQYSTHVEWSWGAAVSWRDEVLRRYVDARLATFNARATPERDLLPYEYRGKRYTNTYAATRSFGRTTKNDISFGAEVNHRSYRTTQSALGINPIVVDEFVRTQMPVSDSRAAPFVQWRGYNTEFMRVLDFETLGLQEDYRIGHDLWVRVYPVTKALGSSRNFFGTYAAAQYTVPLGDGLARAAVESSTEAEPDKLADAAIEGSLRIVTPRLGLGRLVFDAAALNRYRNYLNRQSFLGGDTRLRGYPSNFFSGKDLIAMNLEFRTRPLEIFACQLGGAVFYDVGDAFSGFDNLHPQQSVGGGLRVLFPQIDRVVFRGDIGFPTVRPLPPGVGTMSFFVAFEQAFGVASVGTTATQGTPSTVGTLGQ